MKTKWECTTCPWESDTEVDQCPVDGSPVNEVPIDEDEDDSPHIGVDG